MSGRVSTARIVDPRIEPQPNPVYAVTIGPKQNQFYKIPASGLSDSYLTFNNLTTLGTDRAYLDTFELEIEAEITFRVISQVDGFAPMWDKWTFDSFPFNKCCEEARVNINGGAFFSQPLSYVRAKERYWNEMAINGSYENVCPCNKPRMQNECGLYQSEGHPVAHWKPIMNAQYWNTSDNPEVQSGGACPTRCGPAVNYYTPCASGLTGSWNNSIIDTTDSTFRPVASGSTTLKVKWREPIFASPFSSRIDATYGRPLYNITSMDIAFNMQDLGNMIRVVDEFVESYSIHLTNVNLCYQVMTVPLDLVPSYTIVPYRRYVPYITDGPEALTEGTHSKKTLTSGVYTLNEVPTAIWIFAGPTKRHLQTNAEDGFHSGETPIHTWSNNKLFGFMSHLSISMANTTQILNTAEVHDLYRIAKANGCNDSFLDWSRWNPILPKAYKNADGYQMYVPYPYCGGCGSVLRLIPGTDIILPDQELIPGANANNMVFQVTADFDFPPPVPGCTDIALWVLFEYVGVATITPGQCEITMNPLGDGRSLMRNAPIVSGSSAETPSEVEGSGWLDKIKSFLGLANKFAKKTGIVGTALGMIPSVGSTLQSAARSLGYGERRKRPRVEQLMDGVEGGAVMGLGDFC